jgi:hypothetical protein
LAVVAIVLSAAVLAWATFVESRYGTDAVRFGIYGTWWFGALLAVLGANVLCATLIRIPWKRYQTGFVITHAGILVLLIGCLLTRLGGIDAQLPVFEGRTGHVAYEDTQHFALEIRPSDGFRNPAAAGQDSSIGDPGTTTVKVPFKAGPFNWRDYDGLFPFPWRLARRDRGTIYDRDGIRLEVLDYHADSNRKPAPPLRLKAKSGPGAGEGSDSEEDWQPIELSIPTDQGMVGAHGMGLGGRGELPGGQRFVFWVAESQAETEAFRDSEPVGPLGKQGQVVLHVRRQKFHFLVDRLAEKGRLPLGDTGIQVELDRTNPEFPAAVLRIHSPGGEATQMVLLADVPELSRDPERGIYGVYWYDASGWVAQDADPPSGAMIGHPHKPRIDVIQGADRRLYYRAWKSPSLSSEGELPLSGAVRAFEGTGSAVDFAVDQFVPLDGPGWTLEPAPFSKKRGGFERRHARVRLAVDGNVEEFWLEGMGGNPLNPPPSREQRRTVPGDDRRVTVALVRDEIDVGFQLYLHKFERKLDPGSSQASFYASLVDVLAPGDGAKLHGEVLITLNEPVDLRDQKTGRSYRVFQEAFRGPWKPGDPVFDDLVGDDASRDELFLSWLTINYDPGRGLKYLGSLLIVAGIATMFYMKAYFFRRRPSSETQLNPWA